jgi:hypothetical protein
MPIKRSLVGSGDETEPGLTASIHRQRQCLTRRPRVRMSAPIPWHPRRAGTSQDLLVPAWTVREEVERGRRRRPRRRQDPRRRRPATRLPTNRNRDRPRAVPSRSSSAATRASLAPSDRSTACLAPLCSDGVVQVASPVAPAMRRTYGAGRPRHSTCPPPLGAERPRRRPHAVRSHGRSRSGTRAWPRVSPSPSRCTNEPFGRGRTTSTSSRPFRRGELTGRLRGADERAVSAYSVEPSRSANRARTRSTLATMDKMAEPTTCAGERLAESHSVTDRSGSSGTGVTGPMPGYPTPMAAEAGLCRGHR